MIQFNSKIFNPTTHIPFRKPLSAPVRVGSSSDSFDIKNNQQKKHQFSEPSNTQTLAPITFFDHVLMGNSPAKPLFENNNTAVVMNLLPIRPGHALIIPLRRVERYKELTEEERMGMSNMIRHYQDFWEGLPENKGKTFHYVHFINDGNKAMQTIPRLHYHIVPIDINEPMTPGLIRKALDPTGKSLVPQDQIEMMPKDKKLNLLKIAYGHPTRNFDYLKTFCADKKLETNYHPF